MGAECLASTPNEHYSRFLENVNVSELKDHWPTLKVHKIKKIYDRASSPHPQYSKHTHLNFQKFKTILPQMQLYPQMNKKRIFEIFDHDNQGYLDWNNFYCSISICYFASDYILAVLLFMIFDDHLTKELNKEQLKILLDNNSDYILNNAELEFASTNDIISMIMGQDLTINVDRWLSLAHKFIDLPKFRRTFNIFPEEKLEKQLVQNFNKWNNLFNEEQDRYISYLISYKWFQTWKIYISQEYGVSITNNTTKANTLKAIKTKKSVNQIHNEQRTENKLAKISQGHHLKLLNFNQIKNPNLQQFVKNYDFIHNNIGQRPRQIYNNVLEGEFEDVLKLQIIQNRDYTLVSEKIWDNLVKIYQGSPQFRRTGYDLIELYPKIVKIYSSLFREQIDYSSQVVRQVSGYLTVEELLTRSLEMSHEEINQRYIFYKALGMAKWKQVTDISEMFSEMTSQIIIFFIHLNQEEATLFKKTSRKTAKTIYQINIGDEVIFTQQSQNLQIQKNAIFMGKNTEGKYILHFPNESYIYDVCIIEEEFFKRAKIVPKQPIQQLKLKDKQEINYIGIPNIRGIGFVNCCILHLLKNKEFKQAMFLIQSVQEGATTIIQNLGDINKLLSQKKKINPMGISGMIEGIMPEFVNFQMSMCQNFMLEFSQIVDEELKNKNMKEILKSQYEIKTQKKIKCKKCCKETKFQLNQIFLSLAIPQKNENYFEIVYVPFCRNLNSPDIKRYGFKLPSNALLKDYKAEFQRISQIKSVNYILIQVYNNNIIKNYSSVNNDLSLAKLSLRENDQIYAYELHTDFTKFVGDHYTAVTEIFNKDFKVDMFVDCNNDQRGWIFGKISQIQFMPYTHRTFLRVIHKFSKNESWEISYDLCEEYVASFPTKSFANGEQYHLRMLQRYFNESTNQMQICQMPLVMVLPNWMRWKQFYYMVYLQMKRFIVDSQAFKEDKENQDQNEKPFSNKNIDGGKSPKKTHKGKIKLNKFKQYLNSPNFPYHLNLVDRQGRCATCFKFLKTSVFKGQTESFCQGCVLSQSEPISWQIKMIDIMVCIDWKSLHYLKKQVIKDHSSYANSLMEKKNDFDTLENCLNYKVKQPRLQQLQTICCNLSTDCLVTENIVNKPQNITLYLQRIIQENGFKKTVMKHVCFNLQDVTLNEQKYSLIGLTSVQGNMINTKYKCYILSNQDEWLEYDGEMVKIVKKSVVQKACALVLYYKLCKQKSKSVNK